MFIKGSLGSLFSILRSVLIYLLTIMAKSANFGLVPSNNVILMRKQFVSQQVDRKNGIVITVNSLIKCVVHIMLPSLIRSIRNYTVFVKQIFHTNNVFSQAWLNFNK